MSRLRRILGLTGVSPISASSFSILGKTLEMRSCSGLPVAKCLREKLTPKWLSKGIINLYTCMWLRMHMCACVCNYVHVCVCV